MGADRKGYITGWSTWKTIEMVKLQKVVEQMGQMIGSGSATAE
jgi:hypothetical protein